MRDAETRVLGRHRAELLRGLEGRIVEIGSGSGVNFSYYRQARQVHAIEPNEYLWKRAMQKLRQLPDPPPPIDAILSGVEDEEALRHIPAGSVDAVVCTLVLCSVPDPQGVIRQAIRWLRPGGKLIVLEHIRPHHKGTAFLADLVNPLWKLAADGCHLNRPTDEWLRRSDMTLISEERFHLAIPFYRAVYEKWSALSPSQNPS